MVSESVAVTVMSVPLYESAPTTLLSPVATSSPEVAMETVTVVPGTAFTAYGFVPLCSIGASDLTTAGATIGYGSPL